MPDSETFVLASELPAPRFVYSRRQLANILKCSESLVSAMKNEPDSPGTLTNGSYDVEKWRNYYADRQKRQSAEDISIDEDGNPYSVNAALKKAALEERQYKAKIAKITFEEKQGELVSLTAIKTAITEFSSRLKSLHEHFCSSTLAEKIAKKLTLSDKQLATVIELLEEFHEDFASHVAKLAPNTEKTADSTQKPSQIS